MPRSTGRLLVILSALTLLPALRHHLHGATPVLTLPDSTGTTLPAPNSDSAAFTFSSLTRAPAVRVGTYFNWMVLLATLGMRAEFEPIRDILGVWGTIGWAPYPVAPEEHPTPSELDLAVGIRLQPLPFGILNNLYLDGGKKWYWDLDLWRVGIGWKIFPRISRLSATCGLAWEWGEDTRPIAEPEERWSFPWLVLGFDYGFGL